MSADGSLERILGCDSLYLDMGLYQNMETILASLHLRYLNVNAVRKISVWLILLL